MEITKQATKHPQKIKNENRKTTPILKDIKIQTKS